MGIAALILYLGLTFITGDDYTKTLHSDTYEAINSSNANLHGKNVFICGASKGIGRSISLSFAKAGASCIAIGARSDTAGLEKDIKDAAAAAKKSPPRVLQIKLDVTDQKSSENAAANIENQFGKLDILVQNAGIVGAPDPIVDSDPETWWRTWDVNVRGAYLVTRACLPLMLRGGEKQIVNVSSVGAHLISPGLSSYQTSKLALLRFTEFLISEYGEKGVVAFCIHPGNIVSPPHRAITRVPVHHTVPLLGFLSPLSCLTRLFVLLPSHSRLLIKSRDTLHERIHLAPLSTRNIHYYINLYPRMELLTSKFTSRAQTSSVLGACQIL